VSSPWRIGGLPLLPLVLAMICAAGGFVLVGDAARVQLGFARPPRSVWHWLNARPSRGGRAVARAVSGLVLIGVAAFLAIGLVSRYTVNGYTGDHPVREMVGIVAVAAGAALLIASPVAIGLSMRLDFDKEHRVREQERLRVAAHLHDSVLQTLALIQRQAADPSAVARLARRQEHALRAWMAGEVDLGSATLAVAVRDLVDDAQDEQAMKAELSAIGDMTLDSRGEELTAAAREVLRNASRHAPGAAVTVFLDVGEGGAELFIRDDGPGFEVDAVPTERRGLRDSVIGRMRSVGGSATVESSPGEGTEVALRLPADQSGK
jgi:signal transduction histidine kinase